MFTLSFSYKHGKSPMAYFSFSFPTELSRVRYRMAETMICTSTLDVKQRSGNVVVCRMQGVQNNHMDK